MSLQRQLRKYWLQFTLIAVFFVLVITVTVPMEIPVTRVAQQEPSLLAQQQSPKVPPLTQLIQSAIHSNQTSVVGVYALNDFAYRVVQQPSEDNVFVSNEPGVVTQFASASRYGTIGLLAHNTLAGASFYNLQLGDKVLLQYGNGSLHPYTVAFVREFQALDPSNPYSDFIDVDQSEGKLNSKELFKLIYSGGDQLVFQTCIDKDGEASWGRIFITAVPDKQKSGSYWSDFWQNFSNF